MLCFSLSKTLSSRTSWCLGAWVLGCLGSCVYFFFFSSRACGKMSPALQAGCIQKKIVYCLFLVSFPVFSLLDLVSSVSGRHVFSLCIIKRDPFLQKEMRVGWPWPHSLIYIWILERVAYIHTAVLHDLLFPHMVSGIHVRQYTSSPNRPSRTTT